MLGLIVLGEGHGHGFFFAFFDANQLILETGDKAVRAQNQRVIFGRAAFEGFAVNLADEIHHDLVAVLGFGAFLAVCEILCGFCQVAQGFFHGSVVRFHDQLFQLDLAQVNFGDLGKLFIGHLDIDVVALFPVLVCHFDIGLHGGAVAAVFEMFGHRAVNAFLHDFAHDARAELLFQQRHRDLAFAKALHFNFGLRLDQLFVHFGFDFGRGDRDGVAAFQTFVQRLVDLHVCSIA